MDIKQDDERFLREAPQLVKAAGYTITERDDMVIITKGAYFSIGHALLQFRNALFHFLEVSE